MTIVTVRVDQTLKGKMKRLGHVNWSEVIRAAIVQRVSLEESLAANRAINLELLRRAMAHQDRLRKKTSGRWSGAEEIRKWRHLRR